MTRLTGTGKDFVADLERIEADRRAGKLTDKQARDYTYELIGSSEADVAREMQDVWPNKRR